MKLPELNIGSEEGIIHNLQSLHPRFYSIRFSYDEVLINGVIIAFEGTVFDSANSLYHSYSANKFDEALLPYEFVAEGYRHFGRCYVQKMEVEGGLWGTRIDFTAHAVEWSKEIAEGQLT